jgi:hypothetical protein
MSDYFLKKKMLTKDMALEVIFLTALIYDNFIGKGSDFKWDNNTFVHCSKWLMLKVVITVKKIGLV